MGADGELNAVATSRRWRYFGGLHEIHSALGEANGSSTHFRVDVHVGTGMPWSLFLVLGQEQDKRGAWRTIAAFFVNRALAESAAIHFIREAEVFEVAVRFVEV